MFRVHSGFETLKASDIVTVFHGTDATQCKEFLRRGLDGTVVHYRTHNQGHERGIYITPSIRTALDFGNYILEIRVRAKDLYPTARWGLGSQRKHMKSSTLLEPYAKSFRPMVSYQLNERVEPQAMFIGFVPVKDIVSVHYARPGSTDIEKLSLDEARTRLSLNPKYDIDYSLDMSAEDVLDALAVAHNMTVSEITGILNNYDLDAFCDEFRIPRKLKLRLAMYLKHMRKGTAMSITALSSKLTTAGVKHIVVTAKSSKKWIQDVAQTMEKKHTKGALHRHFGIDESESIPVGLMKQALRDPKTSEKTRKRIQFALNMRKIKHDA